MPTTSATTATEFFTALFADALAEHDNLLVGTWNLTSRRVACHSRIGDAVRRVIKADDDGQTCYYNTTLLGERPTSGRGTEANAGALVSLWADIDVAAPHRHRANLPPTQEAASEFLLAAPLPPSLVIDSGYGMHAYWLLKEPFLLPDDAARSQARHYTTGWLGTLTGLAGQRGWHLDPVGDLARVLRVPGTMNRQEGETPRPVLASLWEPDRRYNLCDFDDLLPAEAQKCHTSHEDAPCEDLAGAMDAPPPFELFEALVANHAKFRKAWAHDRPDLRDQSPSGYDMSLASLAVGADWSDAQIAALIVSFRRKHGLDVAKARRPDYLANTIGRARATHGADADDAEQQRATADVIRVARALPKERPADPASDAANDQRQEMLAEVSRAFGIPVAGWLQFGREPATASYAMRLADGRVVPIGSAGDVLSGASVRTAIYVSTGNVLRRFTAPQWQAVCRVLSAAVELREDVEHSEMETFLERADRYLASQAINDEPLTDERRNDLVAMGHPFVDADEVWINVGHFRSFLKTIVGVITTDREIARCLQLAGFAAHRFNVHTGDHHSRLRYWHGAEDALGSGVDADPPLREGPKT